MAGLRPTGGRFHKRGLRVGRAVAIACALFIGLLAAVALAPGAAAQSRVALVVGNAAYAFGPLANPRRDAEAIARTLRDVGFDVALVLDADRETMRKAMVAFGRKLRGADGVGVFYFAGHGVQLAGDNFLLPIDADVANDSEVALQSLNLSELLGTMGSRPESLSIAILDACRNNPFSAVTRSIQSGLAPVSAPAGTLIAYATAPGAVAYDGESTNSPYTSALVRTIPVPGLSVEDVFKRTRELVLKSTGGRQTPWEHSSLVGSFVFKPRAAQPEASAGLDPDTAQRLKEVRDWARIKDSTDAEVFRLHLAAYPGGAFAELASYKISLIAQRPTGWAAILSSAPVPPRARTQAEYLYERAVGLEGGAPGGTQLPAGVALEVAGLYGRAAELGLVPAMYAYARVLERGQGIQRTEAEAARWLQRAVDQHSAPAMSALGTLYEFGRGVERDLAEATRLYRLAAEAGDAHGMACYAFLLAEGKGVARDDIEARRWYQSAADLGNPRAMFNLALMMMRRQGGGADVARALHLLKAAAARSHTASLRELAAMHDDGRHVARDPKLAVQYLLEAARSNAGHSVLKGRADAWSFATRLELQRRLKEAGHYAGRVSGALDQATQKALLDYGVRQSDAPGAVIETSAVPPPRPQGPARPGVAPQP